MNVTRLPAKGFALLLAALLFPVYLLSPVQNSADSQFSLLVSWRLLTAGTVDLAPAFQDPGVVAHYPTATLRRGVMLPYHVDADEGRYIYRYPHGSSVLSIPLVGVLALAGIQPAHPDGSYDQAAHEVMERWIAALLTTAALVFLFFGMVTMMPPGVAFLYLLAFGLGSSLWTTQANSLWTHTWGTALMCWGLMLVLRHRERQTQPSPWLLACLFAFMCFVRPTLFLSALALFIVALTGFPGYYKRLIPACLVFAVVLGGFFIYFDLPIIPEQQNLAMRRESTWWHSIKLLGLHTISPSRGLLVTTPIVLIALWWLIRGGRTALRHPLALAGLAVIFLHLTLIISWGYYGGHCFGSRLTADILPWFILLGAIGWQAMKTRDRSLSPAAVAIILALSLFGGFVHARGAFDNATLFWNTYPPKAFDYAAHMSWRHPQWMADLIDDPPSDEAPLIHRDNSFVFPSSHPDHEALFGRGWGDLEVDNRWTVHFRAFLHFRLPMNTSWHIMFAGAPFMPEDSRLQQTLVLRLNGKEIHRATFEHDDIQTMTVPLPPHLLREKNTLTFSLPHATSPMAIGMNDDRRKLGFRLHAMQFIPQ